MSTPADESLSSATQTALHRRSRPAASCGTKLPTSDFRQKMATGQDPAVVERDAWKQYALQLMAMCVRLRAEKLEASPHPNRRQAEKVLRHLSAADHGPRNKVSFHTSQNLEMHTGCLEHQCASNACTKPADIRFARGCAPDDRLPSALEYMQQTQQEQGDGNCEPLNTAADSSQDGTDDEVDLGKTMRGRYYSQASVDALLATLSTGSVPDDAKLTVRQLLEPHSQTVMARSGAMAASIHEHITVPGEAAAVNFDPRPSIAPAGMPSIFTKASSMGYVPAWSAYSVASSIKVLQSQAGDVCIEAPPEALKHVLSALSAVPPQPGSSLAQAQGSMQHVVSALSSVAEPGGAAATKGQPGAAGPCSTATPPIDAESRQWLLRMISKRKSREAKQSSDGAEVQPRRWLFSMVSKPREHSAQGAIRTPARTCAEPPGSHMGMALGATTAHANGGTTARMRKQVSFKPDSAMRTAGQHGVGDSQAGMEERSAGGSDGYAATEQSYVSTELSNIGLMKPPSQLGLQPREGGTSSIGAGLGHGQSCAAAECEQQEDIEGLSDDLDVQRNGMMRRIFGDAEGSELEPAEAADDLDERRSALADRLFGTMESVGNNHDDDLDAQRSLMTERLFGAGAGVAVASGFASRATLTPPAAQAVCDQLADDATGSTITLSLFAAAVGALCNEPPGPL